MKKILISTGGSGGHVIPAMCLYDHLKDKFDVKIVTDKRGSKFLNIENYPFDIIKVPNLFKRIYLIPINLIFFIISIFNSFIYLKKNNIEYMFSTGGYMSLPFCFASILLKIKIFLFEPNMVLGRSNKFILNNCKKIICYDNFIKNFPQNYTNKKYLISPLLRKEIYNCNKNFKQEIGESIKILVIGGSQGASFLDNIIKDIIIKLSKDYKIDLTQQVYDEKIKSTLKKSYDKAFIKNELINFDQNLFKRFSEFDIAFTRSGASAISELSFFNIPFIAIPFPSAKDNHQYYNAKYYEDKNCCWILKQKDIELDIHKFTIFIKKILDEKNDYFEKKENLNKISYQNTWNNINQRLISLVNEN